MDASTNDSGEDDDLQDFINSLKPPYQDTQYFQVIIDKDQQLKDTIVSCSSQIQGKIDCGLFRNYLQYILYHILGAQDIYVSQLMKKLQSSQIKELKDENDDQIHHILFQRECERPYTTFRIRQHDPLWSWKLTMIEQFKMMDSLRDVLLMKFSPKRMLVIFQKLVKQIRYNISRHMVAEIYDLNRIKCCIIQKANEFNKEIQQQEIVLISQVTQKIVLYIIGHHYLFPFQKNIALFIKQYPSGNGIYSDEFLGLIEDPIKFWHLGQKYRNSHQDNLIIKIMGQLRLKFECEQVNNLMRQLLAIIHKHQQKHPEDMHLDFIKFFQSKYVSCENIYADIKDLKIKIDNNPAQEIVQPILQENNAVIENELAKLYIEKHQNKALKLQQPTNQS